MPSAPCSLLRRPAQQRGDEHADEQAPMAKPHLVGDEPVAERAGDAEHGARQHLQDQPAARQHVGAQHDDDGDHGPVGPVQPDPGAGEIGQRHRDGDGAGEDPALAHGGAQLAHDLAEIRRARHAHHADRQIPCQRDAPGIERGEHGDADLQPVQRQIEAADRQREAQEARGHGGAVGQALDQRIDHPGHARSSER